MITRREFSKNALRTVGSLLFVESLLGCAGQAVLESPSTNTIVPSKPAFEIGSWVTGLNEYCSDLRAGKLTVIEWQEQLDRLFEKIELDELLELISFEKLSAALELPDLGVATNTVKFPKIAGIPDNTVFVKKLFGLKTGRTIIPHGHSNMSSGHLILSGELRLRQYDTIRKEAKALQIRPSVDRQIGRGDFSSISDERNNVHWFIANKGPAYTFDVIMLDLKEKPYDIHNLDIDGAETVEGSDLRVPIMEVKDALAKYGKIYGHSV